MTTSSIKPYNITSTIKTVLRIAVLLAELAFIVWITSVVGVKDMGVFMISAFVSCVASALFYLGRDKHTAFENGREQYLTSGVRSVRVMGLFALLLTCFLSNLLFHPIIVGLVTGVLTVSYLLFVIPELLFMIDAFMELLTNMVNARMNK